MRKFVLSLMASLLSCSAASAFFEATDSSLEIGVGYRQDSIKWDRKLSGSSSSSSSSRERFSVNSDLHWKDVNIWFIEGRGKYVTCDCIYLRGSIDYGWITSGKLRHEDDFSFDSDFGFDRSFSDSSRNKSHTKGNVWDGKIAIGYQFKWCDDALSIAPVVGYAWDGHEFRNHDHKGKKRHHRNHNRRKDFSSYSYSDYSSYYSDYSYSPSYSSHSSSSSSGHHGHKINDRWTGPFLGFDLNYRFGCCCEWNFFLDYEYHFADYHASEHKREFFCDDYYNNSSTHRKSHVHAKDGSGNVLDFGFEWDVCECWVLGLRAEFQWWEARHGHERTKFFDESFRNASVEGVFKEKIKKITWNSGSIVLDLGTEF